MRAELHVKSLSMNIFTTYSTSSGSSLIFLTFLIICNIFFIFQNSFVVKIYTLGKFKTGKIIQVYLCNCSCMILPVGSSSSEAAWSMTNCVILLYSLDPLVEMQHRQWTILRFYMIICIHKWATSSMNNCMINCILWTRWWWSSMAFKQLYDFVVFFGSVNEWTA